MMYALNANETILNWQFGLRFLNSPKSNWMFFHRLIRLLKMTGSLQTRPGSGHNRQYSDNGIIVILAYFACENPHASIGVESSAINIPRSIIWKIDYARWVDFCNWLLIQHAVNSRFVCNILWTVECLFTEDEAINTNHNPVMIIIGTRRIHFWYMKYITNSDVLYICGVEAGTTN